MTSPSAFRLMGASGSTSEAPVAFRERYRHRKEASERRLLHLCSFCRPLIRANKFCFGLVNACGHLKCNFVGLGRWKTMNFSAAANSLNILSRFFFLVCAGCSVSEGLG